MKSIFEKLAKKHGVSVGAVEGLARALAATGGKSAQFSHPELGGMGQWMPGMIMIGDMFNTTLKARVDALATELVVMLPQIGLAAAGKSGIEQAFAWGSRTQWWPESLGTPTTSGAQNDMAYAYFAEPHRLAIKQGGTITIYDTGGHEFHGVSQSQQYPGESQELMFHTERGPVDIKLLKVIETIS
jgi:hypothetical protein